MNYAIKDNNFNLIDVFRLIFAFCVVGLHVPFLEKESTANILISDVIFDVAVPFFFIVSSFFFFTKCQNEEKPALYFLKYEKRLVVLYVFWSLIYLPFSLWISFGQSFDSVSLKTLAGELINYLRLFIFESTYVHLWYVNTTIICIAILFLIRKYVPDEITATVSLIICIVFSLLSSNNGSFYLSELYFKFVPYVLRNTFRKGLICCSVGMLLANSKQRQSTGMCCFLIVAVSLVQVFFTFFSSGWVGYINDGLSYIFSVIKAASIFLICRSVNLKMSPKYKIIRSFSSLIYFSHLIVRDSVLIGFVDFIPLRYLPVDFGKYIVTVIFTVAISTVIYLLSNMKQFRFLKNIY